jgi:two-component system, NtrC family, nitrogen regulation sensor histidine kinase NtrY
MTTARPRRRSLAGKLVLLGAIPLVAAIGAAVLFTHWLGQPLLAAALAALVALPLWAWAFHRAVATAMALFLSMAVTATSYRDGYFSFSLAWEP